jgi:tRNA pseudouridine55 synthase
VYKQAGPTSHDIVDMARQALGERRIGHTGTLDPMAEGLLLLCVGSATRLQQYLLHWDKTYLGRIKLGHATTTYDREGEPTEPQGPAPTVDDGLLTGLADSFTGEISQLPPPYSAKKVAGKKLYELARRGEEVTVEPKTVTVHSLSLATDGPGMLSLEVRCSTGFYVRSLAHDIGVQLGCGGHLHHLVRTSIGPYLADEALAQDALSATEQPEEIIDGPAWIPLAAARLPFPELNLKPDAAQRFSHGQEVVVFRAGAEPELTAGDNVTVKSHAGVLLGIGAVSSVLARGRTIGVKPASVFG